VRHRRIRAKSFYFPIQVWYPNLDLQCPNLNR
jgi:hypothetical protein